MDDLKNIDVSELINASVEQLTEDAIKNLVITDEDTLVYLDSAFFRAVLAGIGVAAAIYRQDPEKFARAIMKIDSEKQAAAAKKNEDLN